jgi:hypothetical protein
VVLLAVLFVGVVLAVLLVVFVSFVCRADWSNRSACTWARDCDLALCRVSVVGWLASGEWWLVACQNYVHGQPVKNKDL